jgi:hypothetical protein
MEEKLKDGHIKKFYDLASQVSPDFCLVFPFDYFRSGKNRPGAGRKTCL